MKRSAWMFPCSIGPFENSYRLLHENQIKPVGRDSVDPPENNHHTITSNYCLMSRVFANGPGNLCSFPGRVIPKTQKIVLEAALLIT